MSISRRLLVALAATFTALVVAAPYAAAAPVPVKKDRPYSFLGGTKNGKPKVRWNPCGPITWAVVEKGLVAEEIPRITQAFATISAATGLTFEYKGVSKKHRVGTHYHTPIIPKVDIAIMFEDFTQTYPKQPAEAGGFGGAEYWSVAPFVRRGYVQVDSPDLAKLPEALREVLFLHELGHVMGLDHTPGPNIMDPNIHEEVTAYSAGDLAGLKLLGRQPKDCKAGSAYRGQ